MRTVIDFVAKLIAGLALLAICAVIAVVIFFKVIEQPVEHSQKENVGWHMPNWAWPFTKQVKLTPACGYDAWHRDCSYPGLGRVGLVDDPDMDGHEGIILSDSEGAPVIDIQPDGGGLEGELDRGALDTTIRTANRASDNEERQERYAN